MHLDCVINAINLIPVGGVICINDYKNKGATATEFLKQNSFEVVSQIDGPRNNAALFKKLSLQDIERRRQVISQQQQQFSGGQIVTKL